jgi:hypothetical protein
MHALLAACGGFLVAVVWMDLMFDVQVWQGPPPPAPLPEPIVASIASYYARVTTTADPMGRLVGIVMLLTIGGTLWTVPRTQRRRWPLVTLALCGLPIGLAAVRVFPNAVALGTRAASIEVQSELARSICTDHVACWVLILAFTIAQIGLATHRGGPR